MQGEAIPGVRFDLRELITLRGQITRLARLAQRRSADTLSGANHSPFRGRGMEYAESRPYASGDDVRHIDWRVTARSGRTHTKLFQPERERTTAVVYDRAPAMAFGTRRCFKSVQAAHLAALMLWLAAQEGHRLAATGSGETVELMPPLGGRRGVLRVLDALVRWQPPSGAQESGAEAEHLARALEALRRVLRPGSQVLLLLDPRSVDVPVAAAVARLRAHHDLAACLIVDPIELAPPPPDDYRIGDGQHIGHLHLEAREARRRWQAHFSGLHAQAVERLRRAGARVALVPTDADPVDALGALLRGAARTEAHDEAVA
ncbi:DUF58 domain-containing protein [Xanthomonadaceae bacterium JHOS43]|nr:DUF58 domain-containing protein [Xanthomonadaceae bacterium JHOS43]MCX7563068.1 DUF58 domain-containing protein [Xanthomonadaceae bacterium XH05]